MGLLAVEIPDGLVFAIVPIVLVFLVSLMAWIVREQGKSAVDRAGMMKDIKHLQDDVDDLNDRRSR